MSKIQYKTTCLGCGREFHITIEDKTGAVASGTCPEGALPDPATARCRKPQSVRLVTTTESVEKAWINVLSYYRRFTSPALNG